MNKYNLLYYSLRLLLSILILIAAFIVSPLPSQAQELNFPSAGTEFIPSRFDLEIELIEGPAAGTKIQLNNLLDIMVLGLSEPIIDSGRNTDDSSSFSWSFKEGNGELYEELAPLRSRGITLAREIRDSDFPFIPKGFNGTNAKTVYLEVVSLDAKSARGKYRILAGQPLKEKFPNLYQPALGMAIGNPNSRLPQNSFFIPYGVIMTPYGNFLANQQRFIEPIYAGVTPPYPEFPNIPFDLENAGESFLARYPTTLVSVDNPTGPPVAKINYFHFTNASVIRKGRKIRLAPPNQQPQPRRDLGERRDQPTF